MTTDSEKEENDNLEECLEPKKAEPDRLSLSTNLLLRFQNNPYSIIEGKHIFGYDIYPQSARELTTENPDTTLTMEIDEYGKNCFDYAIEKNWMWAFELVPAQLVHQAVFRLFMNKDAHQMTERIMYEHPKCQSPSFVEMALSQKEYNFKHLPRETKNYIQKKRI